MTNKLTMNRRIVLAQRPQPSATLASEFLTSMQAWLRDRRIKYREGIVRGLEHAPQAFLGLLEGANFRKLVVSLDDALGVTA
jgi:NADPH-dependent curcumin reductase CurA